MADLRTSLESIGYTNVQTYIQSGNVIFESELSDSTQLENEIEAQLEREFGFEVPTMLRTPDDLIHLVNLKPFDYDDGTKEETLYICFLKDEPPLNKRKSLEGVSLASEEFRFSSKNLFWIYHRAFGDLKYTLNKVEKELSTLATRRNMSTVRKIVKKYLG